MYAYEGSYYAIYPLRQLRQRSVCQIADFQQEANMAHISFLFLYFSSARLAMHGHPQCHTGNILFPTHPLSSPFPSIAASRRTSAAPGRTPRVRCSPADTASPPDRARRSRRRASPCDTRTNRPRRSRGRSTSGRDSRLEKNDTFSELAEVFRGPKETCLRSPRRAFPGLQPTPPTAWERHPRGP